MQAEVWKPITGFPGYEVSTCGRVRSLDRIVYQGNRWGSVTARFTKGKILKLTTCTNFYIRTTLGTVGGVQLVHRLVAREFVSGYSEELDVNHKDGVRANNFPNNLEWATRSENVQHSYDVLGRKKHKLTTPVVVGDVWYESMLAAALSIGVCPGSVRSALVKNHKVRGMEASYGVSRS